VPRAHHVSMVCPIKNGTRLRSCVRSRLAARRYMPIIPHLCGHVQHTFGESSHTFTLSKTLTRGRDLLASNSEVYRRAVGTTSRLATRGSVPSVHFWVPARARQIVASPACRTPRSTRNTKQPGVRGSGRGCGGYGGQGHAVGKGFADEGKERGIAERARRLARRHLATCFSRRYRHWQARQCARQSMKRAPLSPCTLRSPSGSLSRRLCPRPLPSSVAQFRSSLSNAE